MTTSLHFWLRLLALFLGAWGCIWIVSVAKKHKREKGEASVFITALSWVRWYPITKNILKVSLGVLLGMAAIDLWQYHHTFVLWDLKVIEQKSTDTFVFQKWSQPVGQMFPFTFCSQYIPGLRVGDHVDVIVATQQYFPIRCQNVAPKPHGIAYHTAGE